MEQTEQLRRKKVALQKNLTVSILIVGKCPRSIFQFFMALKSEGL